MLGECRIGCQRGAASTARLGRALLDGAARFDNNLPERSTGAAMPDSNIPSPHGGASEPAGSDGPPARRVYETRACTILYNLLRSAPSAAPWLLPANVCPIVPVTFLKAGRAFEFVDLDESSLCLDPQRLLDRLADRPGRYGGVLFVRTYGLERSFGKLFAAIRDCDAELVLVDDRCLCRPRFGEPLPPHVDVVLYSTGYAKTVDVGFGGFAVLREGTAYRRHELPYSDQALDEVTAAYKQAIRRRAPMRYRDCDWLDARTPRTPLEEYRSLVERSAEESRERKLRINEIYTAGIPEPYRLDESFQNWRFHLRVDEKERLLSSIFTAGLFASSHYADLTPVFAEGSAPVAERFHRRVVNLFNDRYYSEEQAERTVGLVRRHLGL
jgi:dTDP-4-amino-4,6-dideoxygalactose transaminase